MAPFPSDLGTQPPGNPNDDTRDHSKLAGTSDPFAGHCGRFVSPVDVIARASFTRMNCQVFASRPFNVLSPIGGRLAAVHLFP